MSSKLQTNKLIIIAWVCSIDKDLYGRKLINALYKNTMVLNKVEMIEFQLNVTLFSCGISHYQEHQPLSAKTY